MKTIALASTVAAVLLAGMGGGLLIQKKSADASNAKIKSCAEAMESVFRLRIEFRHQCTRVFGEGFSKQTVFNGDDYLHLIQSIETSDCPQDFQAAWLNYVHAWELQPTAKDRARAGVEFLGGAYLTSTGAGVAGAPLIKDSFKKTSGPNTTEAFQAVENVALRYGVQPIRE